MFYKLRGLYKELKICILISTNKPVGKFLSHPKTTF